MRKNVWKTRDVKKSGRKILKNNFATLLMISLFITLIFGGSIGNRTGYSVFKTTFDQIQNVQNYRETRSESQIVKDELDKILSQYLSGNMNGFIKEYNEKNNVYSGFIFSAFNFISNSETEIQKFVKSISEDESKIHSARVVLLIFTSIEIFIRILFINAYSKNLSIIVEYYNYWRSDKTLFIFDGSIYFSRKPSYRDKRCYKNVTNNDEWK